MPQNAHTLPLSWQGFGDGHKCPPLPVFVLRTKTGLFTCSLKRTPLPLSWQGFGDGVNATPASFGANAPKLDYLRLRKMRTPCHFRGRDWKGAGGVLERNAVQRKNGARRRGTLESPVLAGLRTEPAKVAEPSKATRPKQNFFLFFFIFFYFIRFCVILNQ